MIKAVRSQEVIVGHPQRQVIAGSVIVVESVRRPVGSFVGTVQALDHLFIGPVFFGDSIFVLQADDLRDIKPELFSKLPEELLGG